MTASAKVSDFQMPQSQRQKLLKIEADLTEHDFPPQLVIENTSCCNQLCVHCSHKEMKRPKIHMKRQVWDKIVEEVGSEMPECEIWPTFYGEALVMGDEIWDRIDYADKVGCKNIVLNSNGSLLGQKGHIERVLDSPLKRFILSLDGFSKEVYEKVRVLGKRDVVFPAVEKLLKEREQRGQIYPAIICQYSMMEDNEHEVELFREYWKSLGAEVKVRPKLEWTASGSIRSDRIDHHTSFRIACPWGNNTMAIHQDGKVVTCAVDYEGHFSVGNVQDLTVKELWHKLGTEVRAHHRAHNWDKIPDLCKNCRDWQTAGAEYEKETIANTRPFWFKETVANDVDYETKKLAVKNV